jgi:hypothetical protein
VKADGTVVLSLLFGCDIAWGRYAHSMLMFPSAETCLMVVFLARDGLARGGNGGSVERVPQSGRVFSRVRTLSESRLGRSEVMSDRREGPQANRGLLFLDLGKCV